MCTTHIFLLERFSFANEGWFPVSSGFGDNAHTQPNERCSPWLHCVHSRLLTLLLASRVAVALPMKHSTMWARSQGKRGRKGV